MELGRQVSTPVWLLRVPASVAPVGHASAPPEVLPPVEPPLEPPDEVLEPELPEAYSHTPEHPPSVNTQVRPVAHPPEGPGLLQAYPAG